MKKRKLLIFALTLATVLTSYSVGFAGTDAESASSSAASAAFHDVGNHWAKNAIYKWTARDVVNGYNGSFRPNDSITRGEMAVMLDNLMDYQVIADNTFTDLKEGKFYTDPILKANAAGIIQGNGSRVRPADSITREEAAVMLARAFAFEAAAAGRVSFNDAPAVSAWAKGYIAAMDTKGYIKGTNHNFLPKNKITRAEIVTIIDNIVKAYYTEPGTYTENAAGTVLVNASGVTLKGMRISEDLIIAEGVGEGDVILDSVTVEGRAVIRGGGKDSVHINGTSNITSIRIEKTGGIIRLVVSDGSRIQEVTVAKGEKIIITGTVGTLEIAASDVVVNTEGAQIQSTNISGGNVTVEGNGSTSTASGSSRSNHSSRVLSAVSIAGKVAVGSTLTANPTPSNATGTYQWLRADVFDGLYMAIGDDSKTYRLTADDEGKFIKVGITGAGIYTGAQTSAAIGPISSQPVMAGTVAIDGTAKYLETLTANITELTYTPNTSDNMPSYQWKRDGADISGATGTAYRLAEEDIGKKISVTVTADGTNATGASITSAETTTVVKADGPSAPSVPTLVSKTHNTVTLASIAGAQYCMDGGEWQSSPVFTGLTAETAYSFAARIEETSTHLASAASNATEIETAVFPVMSGTVAVQGVAKYNETLAADITGLVYTPYTDSNVPSYQWKRGGVPISGATGSTYTLVEGDVGAAITVTVTADGVNATGANITSAETTTVVKADGPDVPAAPVLASKTHNTVTLAAIAGAQYRMDGGEWQSGHVFTGLKAETAYSFTVRIKETSTHLASAESSATIIETGVFPLMSGLVSIDGITKYAETLTANITGLVYTPNTSSNIPAYKWYRNGTVISGTTGNSYVLSASDIGKKITVAVTADGVNATGAAVTSAETAVIGKADRPAPAAPTLTSKTHSKIYLSTIIGAEYRVNDEPWQTSNQFSGLTAETAYSFTARYRESSTHLTSDSSGATIIETNVFPVMSGTVAINGIPKYNQILTADITGIIYDPYTDSNVPSYQWKRDGVNIVGATAKTYVLTVDDIGKTVTVTVTADGVNATGAGITSTATAAIDKANRPIPPGPTIVSRTDNTITLETIAGAEYRMDGGAWQTSPVFTGLTARSYHYFTIKLNETAAYYESPESSPTYTTTTTNSETLSLLGVDCKMLYVPGGTYPGGTETVSSHWMSETEVTYELWYAVRMWAEENGYRFWAKGMEGSVTGGGDHYSNYPNVGKPPTGASDEPVTCITTYDMMAWLNALSELTGKNPVYYWSVGEERVFKDALGAGITAGITVKGKFGENGYWLPSHSQWEYAARWKGGDSSNGAVSADGKYWTPTSYASGATGNSSSAAKAVAWFSDNAQKTQPVAQKAANGLGFYDMSGNVWEVVNFYPWESYFSGGSYLCPTSLIGSRGNYTFSSPDPLVKYYGTDIGFRFVRP